MAIRTWTRRQLLVIVIGVIGLVGGCLIAMLLDTRRAAAAPVVQPSAGACYASDGVNIETTWIGGSGNFAYPTPSEGVIERFEDGSFRVTHTTLFVPLGPHRVYLPSIQDQ